MEDARFVRFTDDDGTRHATTPPTPPTTAATSASSCSRRRTSSRSRPSPIVGAAAANKGLALFPRRIGGRFAALSRCDRETNTVAFSDNLHALGPTPCRVQVPTRAWEVLQLGNCGSPIETEPGGWCSPTVSDRCAPTASARSSSISTTRPGSSGSSPSRCSAPTADEQDGYVPNVVYSCGALVHAGTLVLPYGIGDAAIGVATVPMSELLATLVRPAGREPVRVAVLAPISWRVPAAPLRAVGAVRVAADRGARRARPRRHAVRDRRLADGGATCCSVGRDGLVGGRHASTPRWRSACTSRRCSSGPTSSTSSTTASTSCRSPTAASSTTPVVTTIHGFSSERIVPVYEKYNGRTDLRRHQRRRPAPAARLRRHDPPRHRHRRVRAPPGARRLPRLLRSHPSRQGDGRGHRGRRARRAAAADRRHRPGRGVLRRARSRPASTASGCATSARSPPRTARRSSAARSRCST